MKLLMIQCCVCRATDDIGVTSLAPASAGQQRPRDVTQPDMASRQVGVFFSSNCCCCCCFLLIQTFEHANLDGGNRRKDCGTRGFLCWESLLCCFLSIRIIPVDKKRVTKTNIAKGTTDPRVEFILSNLDQIQNSES